MKIIESKDLPQICVFCKNCVSAWEDSFCLELLKMVNPEGSCNLYKPIKRAIFDGDKIKIEKE